MLLDDIDNERAESYRVLADLFLKPPDSDEVDTLKQDLELESRDTETEILGDFNDLFMIPGGRLIPQESVFSPDKGVSSINSVTAFYAYAELTIDNDFQEIPDHVSVELLFMSYLIDTKRIDLQLEFLGEHIINWVPVFCGEVIKQAKTVFYKEIAGIARDFLSNEYENIE